MPTTPLEWLPVLAKRMDTRAPIVAKNRRYSEGQADLPEMGDNLRESWLAFQKKARTDYGGLLCTSIADRTIPMGFRYGTTRTSEQAKALATLWRNLRLYIVFTEAMWDAYATGWGYVLTVNRNGQPLVTAEKPEQMVTMPDPAQPWRAQAALKAWRDTDAKTDYATVWIPGQVQRFKRPSTNSNGTPVGTVAAQGGVEWEPIDEEPIEFDGGVPVHALENRRGLAEFEPHIDVIDRINLGKLHRLVVTAMQAFKQRAVKRGDEMDDDEEGNDSDLEGMFSAAPGAVWDLPHGWDIWESASTDISGLLEGEKADARDLAAVTRRSISVFIPDGANQSAEGAASAREGEISAAHDRIARFTPALVASMVDALRILRLPTDESVELMWQPPEHVSLNEKTNAATQAKSAGVSQSWINQRIFGMSPEEMAEEETNRSAEALALASATINTGAPSGNA